MIRAIVSNAEVNLRAMNADQPKTQVSECSENIYYASPCMMSVRRDILNMSTAAPPNIFFPGHSQSKKACSIQRMN